MGRGRLRQKEVLPGTPPGSPVVKTLPYYTQDAGLIPGRGTKIPCALGQLSPCN